jgi:hypothetical protein
MTCSKTLNFDEERNNSNNTAQNRSISPLKMEASRFLFLVFMYRGFILDLSWIYPGYIPDISFYEHKKTVISGLNLGAKKARQKITGENNK